MKNNVIFVKKLYHDDFFQEYMNDESRVIALLSDLGFDMDLLGSNYLKDIVLSFSDSIKKGCSREQVLEKLSKYDSLVGIEIDKAFKNRNIDSINPSTYFDLFGNNVSKVEMTLGVAKRVASTKQESLLLKK